MTETESNETKRNLWRSVFDYGHGSESDRRNQRWFIALFAAWALSFVGANRALRLDTLQSPTSWLVAIAPVVLGLVAVFLYLRMLRGMDELMRRVQLEGLALGFGVGVVFVAGYGLLELAGAPGWGNKPLAVMMFAWTAGQMLAIRRYG